MSSTVAVIAGSTIVTVAIKAAGPVALGGRELPGAVQRVLALVAPALLAALVVVSALADEDAWAIGADTAGVAFAGVLFWRTGSVVGCVVSAAVVTALMRAL